MSERKGGNVKCGRCKKRKAAPLHYLCRTCYAENDGQPRNPGEEIIRLERQRDAYAETLRMIASANERSHHEAAFTALIRERHPELENDSGMGREDQTPPHADS